MIPDYLQQGLGFTPVDDSLAGAPDPYGGLHPAVAQALGLAPPPVQAPATPDAPADQPLQLPSAAQPPATPQPPSPSKDYQVPVSAIDGPGTKPAAPPKPPTVDQQFAQARQAQQQADQSQHAAIQQGADAQRAQAADELQAVEAHNAQIKQIQDEQKASRDADQKTRAQKAAYAQSTLDAVDNYKVDQNKFMHDMGLGDAVGWGIATALASIGDSLQGKKGPNPVIQMMQSKMEQAVRAQVDERDQLKERAGRAEHSLDKFDAFSKDKEATFQMRMAEGERSLANMLRTSAAKYKDANVQAGAAMEAARLDQSSADRANKAVEFAATYDNQKRQLGISAGQLAESKRHNLVEEGWQKTKFEEEQNLKAAALLAKQQGKLTDEESKRAVFVPGPDGKMQALRNPSGDLVVAGSPEIAQKQRDMVAAATSYNRLVGQMARGIADHGGESTWIKGKEWQKMQSDLQSATAELHDAYGITAFREPTVQFFEKMASAGVDPTSFVRDATGALQESNMNLQAKVNEKLGALGYSGPPVKWQDTSAPPAPVKTPNDEVLADALVNPRRAYDDRPGRLEQELGTPSDAETLSGRLEKQGNILPSVRQNLQTWGAMLGSGDPAVSQRARAMLETVVEKSQSPEQAALAKQLLERDMTQQAFRGGEPEKIRGAGGIAAPIGTP